jgi:hypothetical protein
MTLALSTSTGIAVLGSVWSTLTIPLKSSTSKEGQQMTNERMVELFDNLVDYISEVVSNWDDFRDTLSAIGFTKEEVDEQAPIYDFRD